ncbi:hypothetical protein ACQP3D_29760, partial [Escherichia coli]
STQEEEAGVRGLQSKFLDSQGYIKKPCLKKPKLKICFRFIYLGVLEPESHYYSTDLPEAHS